MINKKKFLPEKNFTMMWNEVIVSQNLSSHEKLTFLALLHDADGNGFMPCHAVIASRISASMKSVQRAMQGLTDKGLISIETQYEVIGDTPKRRNIYTLNDPKVWFKVLGDEVRNGRR